MDVEIEKAPENYQAQVQEGKLDAVIVIRPDFHQRFLAGDSAAVELVFDDSRTESQPAIRQAQQLLRGFNRETGTLRLIARGVSPGLIEAAKVELVNTATARQRGAMLLMLIPIFAILSPILGGMTIAIDATAGERERGSLEPLLGNPVPAREIVLGKWLAAWASGALVATFTLAGFVVAASLFAGRKLASLMQFGWPEFGLFLAYVLPFAAATAGLLMLIATYGRSYREAQTYTSYLVSIVSFAPLIAIFAGLKDAFWQQLVPVLAQQMALNRILRGDSVSFFDWLMPAAMAFLIAAACVLAVSRLLAEERIIFGRS
jgi:sodium transport system permease protein